METMKFPRRFRLRISLSLVAALSFAAGLLTNAQIIRASQAKADGNRVFELMIYHTVPGKVPELESIFRDSSKLQAKYLNVVG